MKWFKRPDPYREELKREYDDAVENLMKNYGYKHLQYAMDSRVYKAESMLAAYDQGGKDAVMLYRLSYVAV